MRQHSTETVDKSVCTEDGGGGAARLEAVLVGLVERKARALHAEQSRRRAKALTHPLLLFLRDSRRDESEASIVESPGEVLPSHWCEHEITRHKHKKLKLHAHHRTLSSSDLELEQRRRRQKRRRRNQRDASKPRKHRTLLVSSIDEQAKVIHVLDPDELPRRARYTIMVTACLLLFLCLLLVGVTLRMAPLIDDMDICVKFPQHVVQAEDINSIISFDQPQVPHEFSTLLNKEKNKFKEKEVNVNFGRLNVKKMTGRLDKLVDRYRKNHSMYKVPFEMDTTFEDLKLNLPLQNTTNDTRRQMSWFKGMHTTWDMPYWNRYVHQGESKLKLLDLMLQTIYMSRYRIRDIENSTYFNSEHSSYKIGFAFEKMHEYKKDMFALIETMKNGIENIHSNWYYAGSWHGYPKGYDYYTYPYRTEMREDLAYVVLHQKAWKIYTIYDYLYRILLRLHEIANNRANKENVKIGKLV